MKNRREGLVIFLLSLVFIIAVSRILIYRDNYQWDFRAEYYSARAYLAGLNPYDIKAVSRINEFVLFPTAHSPVNLFFFLFFAKFDYQTAYCLYLILKCVLLFLLIYLWRNKFLDRQVDIIFYLLCAFAFNCAIYLDLRSGNISILEQSVIWLALFYYLKGRLIPFCALIIFISTFKMQPILLLSLLLFTENRKKYAYLLGSLAVFGFVFFVLYLFEPLLLKNFITSALATTRQIESGIDNPIDTPSTLVFMRGLAQSLSRATGITLFNKIYWLAYLSVITVVILLSQRAYSYIRTWNMPDKKKWVIFLTCLVYVLVVVRLKDFSYIILIVPTYFIIRRVTCINAYALLFLLAVVPTFDMPRHFIGNYYPLLMAYLMWILYLYEISFRHKQKDYKQVEI